ncbi:hypothetical protein HELRODRAFT_166632 [Helobdella robusta]|uniref:C2H2-type domain-containing protein n=1 Tax=Helobdella robusta TaxID=6412 RepID=T1EYB0_HELRO|nr:hypothetical protein HELRODRAFT_166632 [Helobdella robusta]ESO11619.1 hypothetical protein HELRODRAFT_166632 [Helobdella robusta]
MVLKEDQERVLKILKETIALLCKNGLNYISDLKIEGLIGVTIDKSEIFLVNLNECITYDNHNNNVKLQQQQSNDDGNGGHTFIKTDTNHIVNDTYSSSVVRCERLLTSHSHEDNDQPNEEIIKDIKIEINCDSDNSRYEDLDLSDPNIMVEANVNNDSVIAKLNNDKNSSGISSPLHLNENTWLKVHPVRTKNQIMKHTSQSYRINNSYNKNGRPMCHSLQYCPTENTVPTTDHYIVQQHPRRTDFSSLSSSSLIDDKLRSHPVVCNMCGKRFPRKLFLQAHMSTQHGLPKPFKCGKCGKGFHDNVIDVTDVKHGIRLAKSNWPHKL